MSREGDRPWRVFKLATVGYCNTWMACERGGWGGPGEPGQAFKTWDEAMEYANRAYRLLEDLKNEYRLSWGHRS